MVSGGRSGAGRCGVERGRGEEGRLGIGVGEVPEEGGRLGGAKKEYIKIATKYKAVLVLDRGSKSTN